MKTEKRTARTRKVALKRGAMPSKVVPASSERRGEGEGVVAGAASQESSAATNNDADREHDENFPALYDDLTNARVAPAFLTSGGSAQLVPMLHVDVRRRGNLSALRLRLTIEDAFFLAAVLINGAREVVKIAGSFPPSLLHEMSAETYPESFGQVLAAAKSMAELLPESKRK